MEAKSHLPLSINRSTLNRYAQERTQLTDQKSENQKETREREREDSLLQAARQSVKLQKLHEGSKAPEIRGCEVAT